METYLYVKCWLVQRVSQSTGELYYAFTSRYDRGISINGLSLEGASYSKFIPGASGTKEPIHTVFANGMNDEMASKAKQLNGNSNVFYLAIPEDDEDDVRVLTSKEYANAQEPVEETFEQPTAS